MVQLDYSSPYGVVRLCGEDGRLCRVILARRKGARKRTEALRAGALAPYVEMLDRYFKGEPLRCELRMLSLEERSLFQRRVYEALATVPFGCVVSYGELARLCGSPGAARAVGQALAANPLPIFLPCHRVVWADGALGGFGAGLTWKRNLLRHEGQRVRNGRIADAVRNRSRITFGG